MVHTNVHTTNLLEIIKRKSHTHTRTNNGFCFILIANLHKIMAIKIISSTCITLFFLLSATKWLHFKLWIGKFDVINDRVLTMCLCIVNFNDKNKTKLYYTYIKCNDCTTKCATKPNEESPNNKHRSNSFLILFAEVRHSAKIVYIFCNQQDTNGLKRWSVIAYTHTHTRSNHLNKEKLYIFDMVYVLAFYLCAKWKQIKCGDRVTFTFIMCRNGNYSFSAAIFAVSPMWRK